MSLEAKKKTTAKGSKRRNTPFPGLDKKCHPRSRWEMLDYDYINKLSDEDKAMLSKFTDEYYGATLANKDDWHGRKKDFHRLKKDRKACQDRNNRSLRDIQTLAKATNTIDSVEDTAIKITQVRPTDLGSQENAVIDLLDLKIALEAKRDEQDEKSHL
jgi:hypothetical protein